MFSKEIVELVKAEWEWQRRAFDAAVHSPFPLVPPPPPVKPELDKFTAEVKV